MKIVIHFLNGNDSELQNHYYQKEYRNDVSVEIDGRFFEVYFFTKDALEYEMRKDGFFSLPGLIILDEISNDRIFKAIDFLSSQGYFKAFTSYGEILLSKASMERWYQNQSSGFNLKNLSSLILKE